MKKLSELYESTKEKTFGRADDFVKNFPETKNLFKNFNVDYIQIDVWDKEKKELAKFSYKA